MAVELAMGVRVLLYIEDDDAAFTLVRIILQEQAPDIRLFRARDGEEAFDYLSHEGANVEAEVPDLILLDLNLPKRNGLEILSDLKATENLRAIPVVMFSTSSNWTDKEKALEKGAESYITKPSSLDSLVEAIRTACSLS